MQPVTITLQQPGNIGCSPRTLPPTHLHASWVDDCGKRLVEAVGYQVKAKQHVAPLLAARRERPPADGLAGAGCNGAHTRVGKPMPASKRSACDHF
jgi:hypothetical protein